MPSPFPGMDPYIEGSEWSSFHAEFCVEIARQLRPQLRPKYVAVTNKYFMTDTPEDLVVSTQNGIEHKLKTAPDVGIARASMQPVLGSRSAVAVQQAPLQVATVMPELVPQYVVEIRDVNARTLVTLIEILSPANKRGEGYAEYVEKRRKVLLSSAHLLELDLLRKGKRVPMRTALPATPYFVFLSRAHKRPLTEVWPVTLAEALPVVPVPLLYDDEDVVLDLQAAFTNTYDAIGFDLLVNYRKPPDVPLDDAKQNEWVATRLARFRQG